PRRLSSSRAHLTSHSFPTRRSSDLKNPYRDKAISIIPEPAKCTRTCVFRGVGQRSCSRDTLSQIQERPVSWAGSGRLGNAESVDLTLGVLRTLTRFTQTHFLPLDLTGVAGNETGLAQFAAQGFVVFHQRTGDTVTDGTSLTGDTATLNSDVNVELFSVAGQFQRLTHDHACSLATEELIESAVVDGDIASTRTQEHPSGGGFTTASTVVLCHRH